MGEYRGKSSLPLPLLTLSADGRQQVDEGGLFKWTLGLMVINPESAFDGGYFKVSISPDLNLETQD
jgi:hypothetical protein